MPFDMKFFLGLFLLTLIPFIGFSQKLPKYGQVTEKDFIVDESFAKDVPAVVLFNTGEVIFDRVSNITNVKIHKRILIANENGIDEGNMSFYISQYAALSIFKGQTYVLENGKITTYPAERNDIITDKGDKEYYKIKKIPFPNVKKGSIIECVLEFSFNGIFVPFWVFQERIPVKYSALNLTIPNILKIYPTYIGLMPLQQKGDSKLEDVTYYLENIPAFKQEKFIASRWDYLASIEFEIKGVAETWSKFETWDAIAEDLAKEDHFGMKLIQTMGTKSFIENELLISDTTQKIKAIYNKLANAVTWDGISSIYINSAPKDVIYSQKGNSIEINGTLYSLLKMANINAYMVLVPTRPGGKIPKIPILNSFNDAVVYAIGSNNEEFLLDATSKFKFFNVLSPRYLNYTGLKLVDDKAAMIPLTINKEKQAETRVYRIQLNANGSYNSTAKEKFDNIAAYMHKEYIFKNGREEFIKLLKQQYNDVLEVKNIEILNENKPEIPLLINYEILSEALNDNSLDFIVFSPFLFRDITKDRFPIAERTLPVDFIAPISSQISISMEIPSGYITQDIPTTVVYKLPDNAGKYTYTIQVVNSTINIISKLEILKQYFSLEDYIHLKEFLMKVDAKQNEKITIKKL